MAGINDPVKPRDLGPIKVGDTVKFVGTPYHDQHTTVLKINDFSVRPYLVDLPDVYGGSVKVSENEIKKVESPIIGPMQDDVCKCASCSGVEGEQAAQTNVHTSGRPGGRMYDEPLSASGVEAALPHPDQVDNPNLPKTDITNPSFGKLVENAILSFKEKKDKDMAANMGPSPVYLTPPPEAQSWTKQQKRKWYLENVGYLPDRYKYLPSAKVIKSKNTDDETIKKLADSSEPMPVTTTSLEGLSALVPTAIDWDKPIQYNHGPIGWIDCRYIAGTGHQDGAIIFYKNAKGRDTVFIHYPPYEMLRNTPPKPRTCEAWVNVYDSPDGLWFGASRHGGSKEDAVIHGQSYTRYIYVDTIKITYTEKL